MFTSKYYKIAGRWYLDYSDYVELGGNPEELERVGAMHELLEQVSNGSSSVTLLLDFQPFDGAEVGVLVGSSGDRTGAYYHLHRLNGQVVDLEIWVDQLIYLKNIELPEKIYGKPL